MEQVLIILLKQVIKLNRKLPCALFTVKKERKTGKCAGDRTLETITMAERPYGKK